MCSTSNHESKVAAAVAGKYFHVVSYTSAERVEESRSVLPSFCPRHSAAPLILTHRRRDDWHWKMFKRSRRTLPRLSGSMIRNMSGAKRMQSEDPGESRLLPLLPSFGNMQCPACSPRCRFLVFDLLDHINPLETHSKPLRSLGAYDAATESDSSPLARLEARFDLRAVLECV